MHRPCVSDQNIPKSGGVLLWRARVLSKRAVWDNGPRSRHEGPDDPLAYYVA